MYVYIQVYVLILIGWVGYAAFNSISIINTSLSRTYISKPVLCRSFKGYNHLTDNSRTWTKGGQVSDKGYTK